MDTVVVLLEAQLWLCQFCDMVGLWRLHFGILRGISSGNRRYPLLTRGKSQWKAAVGIEIHAQITAKSKAFSAAPVQFAATPNTKVALLDASIPGTLPVRRFTDDVSRSDLCPGTESAMC